MLENINEYKKHVGTENKNYCVVLIESEQICKHCHSVIPIGSNCVSINNKSSNRSWICDDCLQLKLDICVARLSCGMTPNGVVSKDLATSEEVRSLTKEYENRAFMNSIKQTTWKG